MAEQSKKAYLLLSDGTQLEGTAFGADKTVFGEIVFNTGMTGYQEILTDPSYAAQVVVMTYPLIGNYGVNEQDTESDRIHAHAFIVKEAASNPSHWQAFQSLDAYLKSMGIPGICQVDTRMLTRKIRTQGTMTCCVTQQPVTEALKAQLAEYTVPTDLVAKVSYLTPQPLREVQKACGPHIALMDLGCKSGIQKCLEQLGCRVTVLPWQVNAQKILTLQADAILFSNGPGDPKNVSEVIETAKALIGKMPLFGICLGSQILALALGADTYKLPFGHRGGNHSVQNLQTKRVMMTTQNHGYAVREETLPGGVAVTYKNLNDGTVEGFSWPEKNIHTVQFHPEAGPGPQDASEIFTTWLQCLKGTVSNA